MAQLAVVRLLAAPLRAPAVGLRALGDCRCTFLNYSMHRRRGFSPASPVFECALHVYGEFEVEYEMQQATDAIEHDDKREPEPGPALHAAST
ncbi:hypothetical protein EV122DRAFT_285322 [Schizophyllum commune]